MRCFGEHAAKRIAKKRTSPECESFAGRGLAANVSGLEADAVHHRYIDTVGDGVGPLDRPPGVVLGHANLGLLRWMPPDSRGGEQDMRALQRRQSSTLGIPLVPATERAHPSYESVTDAKS